MKMKFFLATLLFSNFNNAYAVSPIEFRDPSFSESCNLTNSVFDISPDNNAVTIALSDFTATTDLANALRNASKRCKVTLPMKLPDGFTLSSIRVGYAGFATTPKLGYATLNSKLEFKVGAVQKTSLLNHVVSENFNDDFQVEKIFQVPTTVCGGEGAFTMDTIIKAIVNGGQDNTLIAVDSKDLESSIVIHFKLAPCNR